MPEDYIEITASAMRMQMPAALTPRISMLPPYFKRQREKLITIDGQVTIVNETPVSALIDGGGGLGYVPAVTATRLTIKSNRQEWLLWWFEIQRILERPATTLHDGFRRLSGYKYNLSSSS